MATNQQAIANKNNAAKSTGPKTEDGKASVSGNALKHGLRVSRTTLLQEDYAWIRKGFAYTVGTHEEAYDDS